MANSDIDTIQTPGGFEHESKEHELPKERKLFLQLLRNYPDGAISVIDKEFSFILTGGELHNRLGVDPKYLIGREIYPKFPAKLRQVIIKRLEKVFQGNNLSEFELPFKIKGEYYVMDAFPLKEKDDSVVYAGVIIRNISHLKKAEMELRRALKKEKELSELKSRFVSMASHEFRTPLSAVLSSACLVKKYITGEKQDQANKHLDRIISSVNMLTDILNDFLSIGKIEEGKVVSKPVELNIKEVITAAISDMAVIQKKGQYISYGHSGPEWTSLDPVLLKHIVINLLSNAIKFSSESSPIEIKTEWINNRLVISVQDYGIGIPEESQAHLFKRFYRASNVTNIQGTGLGLHIVSKYLELMNGKIEYTSKLNKGTRFVISF